MSTGQNSQKHNLNYSAVAHCVFTLVFKQPLFLKYVVFDIFVGTKAIKYYEKDEKILKAERC